MNKTQSKIHKLTEDIKSLVKSGSKNIALTLLSQKKKLDGFMERISSHKYKLEDQLLMLEELETQSVLINVLDFAAEAGKTL